MLLYCQRAITIDHIARKFLQQTNSDEEHYFQRIKNGNDDEYFAKSSVKWISSDGSNRTLRRTKSK